MSVSEETTTFEPGGDLGDIWAITQIWHQLPLAQSVARMFDWRSHQLDVESVIRTLVLNHLSDPRAN